MKFDYYYGEESEQYSFLKIPKLFFTDKTYESLSLEAKLLYGLMLDRMALSAKRGWYDAYNRAYIKYTSKAIAADMGINRKSALKYMKELSEFGLIIKVQQTGLSDVIYVMNFAKVKQVNENPNNTGFNHILQDNRNAESINSGSAEQTPDASLYQDESSGPGGGNKNLRDMDLTGNPAQTTSPKFTPVQILHTPEQKNNKNNYNNINTNMPDNSVLDNNTNQSINQSVYPVVSYQSDAERQTDMTEEEYYEQLVKSNIDYDIYMQDKNNREWYDEYYNIILEVVMRKADKVFVAGSEWPQNFVKSRFLKITASDMLYVHDRMQHTVSDIKNIKAYLVAALFNAPTTNKSYWNSRVNHDMSSSNFYSQNSDNVVK